MANEVLHFVFCFIYKKHSIRPVLSENKDLGRSCILLIHEDRVLGTQDVFQISATSTFLSISMQLQCRV